MKYTKYPVGPYNIHIINTDKFKTVSMKINFRRKIIKEELTIRRLLVEILTESSRKYPTQRDLIIALEDLYNLKLSQSIKLDGTYSVISFMAQFLNEKYTEKGMLEKSILFLFDIIFDPDFENGKFKESNLKKAKNRLIEIIKENEKDPTFYANSRMVKIMGAKEPYSFSVNGYIEEIDNINTTNLTKYYKQVLHSDIVDIFIIGNVDPKNIKAIIQKNFGINTIKKQGENPFYEHQKFRKRARKQKEDYDSYQTKLVIGAKIAPLTDFERKYVAFVYNFILGGSPDSKLFRTVREQHSLCYSISSRIRILQNLLIINAGIDKENIEKTVRLIRKEMNSILKGIFEDSDIEKAKINFKNFLQETMDDPYSIIRYYVEQEYYNFDLIETRIKKIDEVDRQKVIEFAKKIHVDTIFALEGGKSK
ncbi:MAG: insulinase family protein [Mollicutes bacterium]|nr:insulinase family protein [Mollicutes bacterium]